MFKMSAKVLGVAAAALIAVLPMAGTATASASARPATPVIHETDTVLQLSGKAVPFSGTGCTHGTFGNQLVCIYVNGTGLTVNYATVTNKDAPTGEAMISDTFDGQTYYGPFEFGHGQAWRWNFYVRMKNNDKVCGSVSGLDVACLVIHT